MKIGDNYIELYWGLGLTKTHIYTRIEQYDSIKLVMGENEKVSNSGILICIKQGV